MGRRLLTASKMACVSEAFGASRSGYAGVGVLSLVINLLMLTGPMFMLQIYDRVLASTVCQHW
ncbi:hypothetical protein [Pseudovibrio denitrificans]|uniref:hypothetical protein n=1 Tax=Pseudovibrio denitrificans TaxID=258256 RepID=UPI001AD8C1AF|nr:hypothetical protein [Pseudovibrio denitrificans]